MAKNPTNWTPASGYGYAGSTDPEYVVDENGNFVVDDNGDRITTGSGSQTDKAASVWSASTSPASGWDDFTGSLLEDLRVTSTTGRVIHTGAERSTLTGADVKYETEWAD
jgi:hypothetical protein